MNRRALLGTIIAVLAQLPKSGFAQQMPSRRPVVGFLVVSTKAAGARYFSGFAQGMRELGHAEGRDYVLEERYADGDLTRLPALVSELVDLRPDVIVVSSSPVAAAIRQTMPIPTVGAVLTDPVGFGLVASEARPGANVTGILARIEGLPGKYVEIARDVVPTASRIGLLVNTADATNLLQHKETEAAAAKLGVALTVGEVRSRVDLDGAFRSFARAHVEIAIVLGDAVLLDLRRQIAAFALAARLPTVHAYREHVEDGGLISYGINQRENYRRAAYFVNRILKGEKPADLPVEFPTKLEMVVNMATAKALGLAIQPSIMLRVDEVIE
jgi:putative ABC transport system substrate-binding protein